MAAARMVKTVENCILAVVEVLLRKAEVGFCLFVG